MASAPASVSDLTQFDYALPPERIAQEPAEPRDAARLLVLERQPATAGTRACATCRLPRAGRLPRAERDARRRRRGCCGRNAGTGGAAEVLLLHRGGATGARSCARRGRCPVGSTVLLAGGAARATRHRRRARRRARIRLAFAGPVDALLEALGEAPLPPYIRRGRARRRGRRALPDGVRARAGRGRRADGGPALHARRSSRALAERGASSVARRHAARRARAPSGRSGPSGSREHRMHAERFELPAATAAAVARTRARGAPRRRGRHDDRRACSRRRGAPTAAVGRGRGRDRPPIRARPPLPRRRRAAHELPPAALVAAPPRRRLRRPRARCSRAYADAVAARLPLLQLRRRDADRVS